MIFHKSRTYYIHFRETKFKAETLAANRYVIIDSPSDYPHGHYFYMGWQLIAFYPSRIIEYVTSKEIANDNKR
jgi:hypothetical protein